MDMESGKQQLITSVKKYQYIILIILIGVFLMLYPSKSKEPETSNSLQEPVAQDLEAELAVILSRISGVGKAQVLLAEAAGSNTIYQMDTGQNQSHSDTVIIMDSNREETGLVKQILPPVYRGAVIACQGADSANVRLAVVEAVKSVTGLSADCITVLKMH
jgi:stage III sporulation protein AG